MGALIRLRNNFLSLVSAEIITKACGALMYFMLARYLGPHDFGVYSLAISFALIFGLISGLGIDSFIVKEIARDPSRTQVLFENSVLLKMIGGLIAFLLAVGLSYLMGYNQQTQKAIVIFSFTLFFSSLTNLYDSVFRGFQRMEYSAMILIGRSFFTIIIIMAMIFLQQDIHMIVSAHVATGLILVVISHLLLVKQNLCQISLNYNLKQALSLIVGGMPFIATGVVYVINAKADILLLSKLANLESVGIYDAANELVLVILIIPSLISQVLYPYLSQQFHKCKEVLGEIINLSMRIIIAVSVPVSFGLVILAPKIISLLYGHKYTQSAIVLQIMGSGLSIVFLRSILGWVLAAIEKVNVMMWINIYNLALNIIFNVILIPMYGYIGAAIATITSMVFGTIIVIRVIKSVVTSVNSISLLFIKPILSSMVMAVFLLFLPRLNLFFQVFIGAGIYLLCFILLKGISGAEWNLLRGSIPVFKKI